MFPNAIFLPFAFPKMMPVSFLLVLSLTYCQKEAAEIDENPANTPVEPDVITEKTLHDSDDPAIWINKENPAKSIIFGTDKNSDGAVYAFDLEGKIIEEKTIRDLSRPNNIDVEYDFQINETTFIDVLAITEREKKQIRLFSVPDMLPLDNGGFPVFEDEETPAFQYPMGISLYSSPVDQTLYVIVSRKDGPQEGYLYQYKVIAVNETTAELQFSRKFGNYSGKKEIEAIAVDDQLGYIYYSDETFGIRKYHAEPSQGNEEVALFGRDNFKEDHEGIAIATYENGEGYLIISNQQEGTFNIFTRKTNDFVKEIDLSTQETDGCDIVTVRLNETFKSGIFVAMNNDRNFYFYNVDKLNLDK